MKSPDGDEKGGVDGDRPVVCPWCGHVPRDWAGHSRAEEICDRSIDPPDWDDQWHCGACGRYFWTRDCW